MKKLITASLMAFSLLSVSASADNTENQIAADTSTGYTAEVLIGGINGYADAGVELGVYTSLLNPITDNYVPVLASFRITKESQFDLNAKANVKQIDNIYVFLGAGIDSFKAKSETTTTDTSNCVEGEPCNATTITTQTTGHHINMYGQIGLEVGYDRFVFSIDQKFGDKKWDGTIKVGYMINENLYTTLSATNVRSMDSDIKFGTDTSVLATVGYSF
jgi:opacity protein-like surface antigen